MILRRRRASRAGRIPPECSFPFPVIARGPPIGYYWRSTDRGFLGMKKSDLENEIDPAATSPEAAADTGAAEPLVPVDSSHITPEQLDELKQLAGKASEHYDRLLRTTADFENFRKRAAREKQEAIRYANETLLTRLLPVLDSFDMALSAARQTQGDAPQSLQAGVEMVLQQLKAALKEGGVEEVDAMGQPFDPNFHEAIGQRDEADVPEGQVVQQLRKGYKLRERLLRPASVIVARKPQSDSPHV